MRDLKWNQLDFAPVATELRARAEALVKSLRPGNPHSRWLKKPLHLVETPKAGRAAIMRRPSG
jgi:hypothetical protein